MSQETLNAAAGGQTPAAPLYDADAAQIIKVTLTRAGKAYEVFHTLRACTDANFTDYDKAKKARLRVHTDKSIERITDDKGAALYLYGALLDAVRGWGDPAGANVDERQRRMVVEQGLLLCAADTGDEGEGALPGNAEEDRPWETPEDGGEIRLRCRFQGEEIVTRHWLTDPSAEQRQRYESLQARKKYRSGTRMTQTDVVLQSPVKALGKLYDELHVRAEGYRGRVPLWHKVEVVSAVFEEDEQQVGED